MNKMICAMYSKRMMTSANYNVGTPALLLQVETERGKGEDVDAMAGRRCKRKRRKGEHERRFCCSSQHDGDGQEGSECKAELSAPIADVGDAGQGLVAIGLLRVVRSERGEELRQLEQHDGRQEEEE